MRDWHWKGRDGTRSGLLYEPGNWGDLLKMVWLSALLPWKVKAVGRVDYFDPFAGRYEYHLGDTARRRLDQADLRELDFLVPSFIERGKWPSAAAAACLLAPIGCTVFDADPSRLESWQGKDVTVAASESGWSIISGRHGDDGSLWMLDPYDFMAEWREQLSLLVEKSRTVTIVVYIFNRSASRMEAFREYRAFRNSLDDALGDRRMRLGRVAADGFLPRAHHELLLLPSAGDVQREDYAEIEQELANRTVRLADVVARSAVFA